MHGWSLIEEFLIIDISEQNKGELSLFKKLELV